jgi:hypothetical protein
MGNYCVAINKEKAQEKIPLESKQINANTANGAVRVCQKYVGESDYAAPARHYRLLINYRYMIVSLII